MPNITRVFPSSYLSPRSTFNLILLSDGYVDETAFVTDCERLREELLRITPFNQTRFYPTWIGIYRHFKPSANGPAVGAASGGTAYGSSYDPATGSLTLDVSAVIAELETLVIAGEDGEQDFLRPCADARLSGGRAGSLAVVMLPASAGPLPISAEAAIPFVAPQGLIYPIVATTTDGRWAQVVARSIALALGLGDESEPSVDPGTPSDVQGLEIDKYPNLVFLPEAVPNPFVPTPGFKWWHVLDGGARTGLEVVARGSTVSLVGRDERIRLVEGGGGYKTGVFRSAIDCLMRRRLGGADRALKDKEIAFCPICSHALQHLITGKVQIDFCSAERITLSTQKLKFDHAFWPMDLERIGQEELKAGFRRVFQTSDVDLLPMPPYCQFIAEVDPSAGLVLRQFTLEEQRRPLDKDFMSRIDFRGIFVTLSDGRTLPFDVAHAIRSGKAFLETAAKGSCGQDDKIRRGIKLTLEDTVGGCEVRVEMSIVIRAESHDFEPLGVACVTKIYPQIGLTWSAGSGPWVKSIRASVVMHPNNVLGDGESSGGGHAGHAGHGGGPAVDMNRNVLNFYSDTNQSHLTNFPNPLLISMTDEREGNQVLDSDLPLPGWYSLFDYGRPNHKKEFKFTAVKLASESPARQREYKWPDETTRLTISRVPRQGQYDNVHVHGYMGDDPITGEAMAHAPACGEACFHLHFRWGGINAEIPDSPWFQFKVKGALAAQGLVPETSQFLFQTPAWIFKGWGHDPNQRFANFVPGAPLVPPNQRVTVSVANRETPMSADGLGAQVDLNRDIHPREKAVWYTVDVENPNPGERQVLLEQGIAFAYQYIGNDNNVVTHEEYQEIRWFGDGLGIHVHQQVPYGYFEDGGPAAEDF